MQRVLVLGPGGSGKSTLSNRLGALLGIPVIHLDTLFWKPGWIASEETEWADRVRRIVERESWILDGNYSGTLAERLEACDTAVFLDVPRIVCLWRVVRRVMKYRGECRPDMPDGCPERFDVGFLLWIWNYPKRSRDKVLSLLERNRAAKEVVELRTANDVERFVATVAAAVESES